MTLMTHTALIAVDIRTEENQLSGFLSQLIRLSRVKNLE